MTSTPTNTDPVISHIYPTSGTIDTEVTITGEHLKDVTAIQFGDTLQKTLKHFGDNKIKVNCPKPGDEIEEFGGVVDVKVKKKDLLYPKHNPPKFKIIKKTISLNLYIWKGTNKPPKIKAETGDLTGVKIYHKKGDSKDTYNYLYTLRDSTEACEKVQVHGNTLTKLNVKTITETDLDNSQNPKIDTKIFATTLVHKETGRFYHGCMYKYEDMNKNRASELYYMTHGFNIDKDLVDIEINPLEAETDIELIFNQCKKSDFPNKKDRHMSLTLFVGYKADKTDLKEEYVVIPCDPEVDDEGTEQSTPPRGFEIISKDQKTETNNH